MLLCPNTTFCRTLLCSLFKEELERDGGHDVDKRLQKEFPKWFNNHVSVVMSICLAVKKILVFVLCVCVVLNFPISDQGAQKTKTGRG